MKSIMYLKWAVFTIVVGMIGVFVLPIMLTMAINAVSLAALGLLLAGIWFFLPAICEWFAQGSMWAWEKAVRSAPLQRLRRDLKAHSDDIDNLEKRIGESGAAIDEAKVTIKNNKAFMDSDAVTDWASSIDLMSESLNELVRVRDSMIEEHRQFERLIQKAEADMKIGAAFAKANKSLAFGQKNGVSSTGSKVALDEVQRRLSESRSTMQIMLSRPKLSAKPASVISALAAPSTEGYVAALNKVPSPVMVERIS